MCINTEAGRILIVCLLLFAIGSTACTTLPPQTLYTEPIAETVSVNTLEKHYDVSYSIHCSLMEQSQKDFISFIIDSMLYTYRLDFIAQQDIKYILDTFFRMSEIAIRHNKQNGFQYLGESRLYAYVLFENTVNRLLVHGRQPNHIAFNFLLKDGIPYLVLERFSANNIGNTEIVDNSVDSIPFYYEDIKKIHSFFSNQSALTDIRIKQQNIQKNMGQQSAADSLPSDTSSNERT